MARPTIDLTGVWRAQPDVATEGEGDGYFAADFDVRRWREVAVPSSFGQVAPGLGTYEGAVWYRRTFDVPAEWEGRHVVLRFEGANYHTKVWVNGCPAGRNDDGFLRFDLPVSAQLKCGGENVVVVRVDGIRRQGEVPGMERGWQTFGGILREVCLIACDPLRVEDVVLTAEPSPEGGVLWWQVRVENGRPEDVATDLTVTVLDADGRELAQSAGSDGEVVVPGAAPWTPDAPALYMARVDLSAGGQVVDSRTLRFGFRRIETDGTRLLLNGEPIFLTGFNRHEDSPRTGMCTDLRTVRRDLLAMKEMGCNFIRLCHYPHHPGELDLCDEIGLLVMGEIPVYWWRGLEEGEENSARKLAAAKRQLTSMILRDRNHPSVIFWSASNECREDRSEVVAGNDELVRLAKELDPSRLAVHVSCVWTEYPHFTFDDVVCINAYPTWHAWADSAGGEPPTREHVIDAWTRQPGRLRELYPDKPILVTEFGHPCFEDVFGTHMGEDAQADAIEMQFGAMTAPYICGATVWCWADHPWPQENFVRYVTTSPFGVVTRERRKLHGYWTARRIFRERQGIVDAPPAERESPSGGRDAAMVRPDLDDIPDVPFPDGFAIRPMRSGEAAVWTDIHRDAEPHFGIGDGLFHNQFGMDLPAVERRCFFVVDDSGSAVAAASAWYSRDFKGGDWGRIHWVATRRAYQRRGLARAAVAHCLKRLAEWHDRAYLTTSTARLGAIRLYLDLGFVPDLDAPEARAAWAEVQQAISHPVLDALDL